MCFVRQNTKRRIENMKIMKLFYVLTAYIFLLVCLVSCSVSGNKVFGVKDGRVVQKKFMPGQFVSVCNASVCDVQFKQSDSTYVELHGDENVLKHVSLKCDGNELVITTDNKPMFDRRLGNVLVIVCSPDLTSLKNSGTGDFNVVGKLDTDNLYVGADGTGDVEFDYVVCDSMSVEINGTGDFEAKRVTAISFSAIANGTGDMSVSLHKVDNSSFLLSGTGDADVNYVNCVNSSYSLSGTGDLNLSGDLWNLKETADGSGDVDKHGLAIKHPERMK